ncbi:hypothetical protein [Gemmatimonas sp.]|jgi:hypothetical protein|uniref:hypothetical protein n=1 Tax=Gemmatimonas sp. TaxID=1962908 RepID=UPI0037BE6F6E
MELVMRVLRSSIGVLAALALLACEHPIAVVTPHAEVADLVFSDSTTRAVVMRTTDNQAWSGGPLQLCADEVRTLVPQALDFRGLSVDLVSRRDLEIRGESSGPNVIWEPLRGRGRLIALAPGTTRVRFVVWHITHADLVSPWLDVIVHPRASCPVARSSGGLL